MTPPPAEMPGDGDEQRVIERLRDKRFRDTQEGDALGDHFGSWEHALAFIAQRLEVGRKQYGPLRIATDPRSVPGSPRHWRVQRMEEIADKFVYEACEEIANEIRARLPPNLDTRYAAEIAEAKNLKDSPEWQTLMAMSVTPLDPVKDAELIADIAQGEADIAAGRFSRRPNPTTNAMPALLEAVTGERWERAQDAVEDWSADTEAGER